MTTTCFSSGHNGDITLKARWIPIHTIVFDSNGGSEVGPQAVPAGGKIVQPKVPVKSGNLFAGWHLMTEDGIAAEDFDFSNAVDSDITLKARWIPISVAKILNLPSGLVSVKSGAFIGVESAHAIRLPGNLTSFDKDAFDEGMTILAPADSPAAHKAQDLGMLVVEE